MSSAATSPFTLPWDLELFDVIFKCSDLVDVVAHKQVLMTRSECVAFTVRKNLFF
jgi:hypothetical protein